MFDQLFKDPHALARQRNGPLAEERRRYLTHCAAQQMAPKTLLDVATYLFVVANALRLGERSGDFITPDEIKCAADRWVSRHSHQPATRTVSSAWHKFTRYAMRWLSFLGWLQMPAPATRPYADLITKFADDMRQERGLSPRTIDCRCRAIHDFMARLDNAGLQLNTLTVAQVDDILARKIQEDGYARVTVRAYAYRLRVFFRFAEGHGCCRPGLSAAIMIPRVFLDETIPAGPCWENVQRLLATTEGSQLSDIRARAALAVQRYGGRLGDRRCPPPREDLGGALRLPR